MLKPLFIAFLSISTSAHAGTLVFQNVNVIPMTDEKVLPRQTVIVKDGKIDYVGTAKFKLPADTQVIDGTGKYLLPGLAEMHGHIPPPTANPQVIEDVLFEYVANGITTVRGMLGHPGQLELKKRTDLIAPNLYLAGPSFNANSINSPEEAIAKVRQQKKEGWDLLKVHPGLTLAEYDAMARTAAEVKMRFGGHVPVEVGLLHALEMGQETFDHIDGYYEYVGDDPKKLAEAVKLSRERGVWIVPTSALWEVLHGTLDLKTLRSYPELKYVPQQTVDTWTRLYNERLEQIPRETAKNVIARRVEILRALNEGGVKILMGTDAPQQFSVPGFSLHRELERMRQAGMTPYQILVSGTRNVGEYFKEPFGTVAKGNRADLILVDANPLDDITNLSRISGVMVRGRWLPKADIDKRLVEIDARY
jgi:imidazolonepropionase-like amidohydrolase